MPKGIGLPVDPETTVRVRGGRTGRGREVSTSVGDGPGGGSGLSRSVGDGPGRGSRRTTDSETPQARATLPLLQPGADSNKRAAAALRCAMFSGTRGGRWRRWPLRAGRPGFRTSGSLADACGRGSVPLRRACDRRSTHSSRARRGWAGIGRAPWRGVEHGLTAQGEAAASASDRQGDPARVIVVVLVHVLDCADSQRWRSHSRRCAWAGAPCVRCRDRQGSLPAVQVVVSPEAPSRVRRIGQVCHYGSAFGKDGSAAGRARARRPRM